MGWWDQFNTFLESPAKVWHVALAALLVGAPIGTTLGNMQRQMTAIGKVVVRIWGRLEPDDHD